MGTDEDYLDSLLKAATEPDQNGDIPSDGSNIYDSLLMDEQQLAEIDELLGLVDDAAEADSSESSNRNDDISAGSTNSDNEFEQLLGDMEPTGTKEENILPDIEPFAAEEEPVDLDVQPSVEEEAFSMDGGMFSEEESLSSNEADAEEIPVDTGADLERQIESAMMDNSHSGELEIDLNGMEDLDALLGMKDVSSGESESEDNSEDKELGDLLDGLGDDEELAEINELLKKSQNNEFVDEDNDMLALLEGVEDKVLGESEDTPADNEENNESAEESPKKKKWGRKKKAAQTDEEQSEASETGEKKASQGFFGKLFAALTEEEEEPEENALTGEEGAGEAQQENEQPAAKKKGKKAKKKKGKKGAETNEEILEEMDAEDAAAKKAKKKKPKKEKKPKKDKPEVIEEKGKKIPRKMIIRIFVLCFSIMVVIILPSLFLPQMIQKSEARNNFYEGNYQEAYEGLVGYDLNDSDAIILRKAELLSQLERKAKSYEAYRMAGENEKALNALLEGVFYYQNNLVEITSLGIQDDALTAYGKLLGLLQSEYSLGEAQVMEILALDKLEYTYRIKELTGSSVTSQQGSEGALPEGGVDGQGGSEAGNGDENLQPAETPEGNSVENPADEETVTPEPLEDQLEEETY